MKKLSLLLCLALVLGMLGGVAGASETITIEFFQQKMEEGPQKGYQAVIDKFHEEYPNIRIELNTVPDAGSVLVSRISSGDIPPLFSDYPTQMQFREKVKNGIVLDITEQEFLSRSSAPAIEMSRAHQDGKNYALPLSGNYMGVYYNIDIFEENGLSIPTTYDELLAVCAALEAADIQPFVFTFMDPGRVGHMFQTMTISWSGGAVYDQILEVIAGNYDMNNSEELRKVAGRILEVIPYGNSDAFAVADTSMWDDFANGRAAMCITGSYARGTILLANPDVNMGVFPLPSDTEAETTILTGLDAALCVSAQASPEEQDAALKFLEFISRPESAQIFYDHDGAPSLIAGVVNEDTRIDPVINKMQTGPSHDWMASTVDGNVQSEIYNVVQQLLIDHDVDAFLANVQDAIVITSQQ